MNYFDSEIGKREEKQSLFCSEKLNHFLLLVVCCEEWPLDPEKAYCYSQQNGKRDEATMLTLKNVCLVIFIQFYIVCSGAMCLPECMTFYKEKSSMMLQNNPGK